MLMLDYWALDFPFESEYKTKIQKTILAVPFDGSEFFNQYDTVVGLLPLWE